MRYILKNSKVPGVEGTPIEIYKISVTALEIKVQNLFVAI
jgi:hypothetical protein